MGDEARSRAGYATDGVGEPLRLSASRAMHSARCRWLVACVLALSLSAPAFAAEPPPTTDEPVAEQAPPKPWAEGVSGADQDRALELFGEGNKLFTSEAYGMALAFYRRAIDAWDHPAIRFDMMVCQLELEEEPEAWT